MKNVTSDSFNGTAMAKKAQLNYGFVVDAIYTISLGSSASSSVGNIVVTSEEPTAIGKYITARVYQNVNQTTPLTNILSASGATSPNTLTVTSVSDNLVIDILDTYNSGTTGTRTPVVL